ncbi:MAG: S41 family peptidase [Porphyromonadaceae bacterium]|nr:MAG: S41 family peptidase [Porphyromonadaceae bacterium]
MSGKNSRIAIWLPIVLACCLVTGMFIGNLFKNNSGNQLPVKVFTRQNKLSSILDFIENNYVDSVNPDSMTETIIPILLEKLDPHSIYIPPRELKEVNETLRGNFDGIGVQFNMQNDTILVIQTVKGGPSEKAGLLAGDRIISVNGIPVAGVKMPEDSIVNRLRGERDSDVKVGIYRKRTREKLVYSLKRGIIPVSSIDVGYMAAPGIGYIKITTFSQTTYPEFQEILSKLKRSGCRKLIIDLRGNTGGIMDPAIRIADDFLDKGQLIVYTKGRSRAREEYRATQEDSGKDLSLAILIDESSASASEIVAGAIQDNDRGWIIGRRSFGKGLVQEQAVLNDGSALRLTTARYYTPTGRSIQKPYTHGSDDYYHDIAQRYKKGEFMVADSIHFNDSLKYNTPEGRIVYGGGGIMPDYFVPYDTSGITPFFLKINAAGLIYKYALTYSDLHRDELLAFNKVEELADYLDSKDVLGSFKAHIIANGFNPSAFEWKESRLIIRTQLKAYIARNFMDNEGFYPIIQTIDNTLNKAIEVLRNKTP